MKLIELGMRVAQQPNHGINFDRFKNLKQIGTLDSFKIFESNALEHTVLFTVRDEDKDICHLVALKFKNAFGECLQFKRTWMNHEYRNKGIMTKLYKKLYQSFNYNILSDTELSPESTSIWKKLLTLFKGNVFLLNISTGDYNPVTDFNEYLKSDSLVFLIKHETNKGVLPVLDMRFNTILDEYELANANEILP